MPLRGSEHVRLRAFLLVMFVLLLLGIHALDFGRGSRATTSSSGRSSEQLVGTPPQLGASSSGVLLFMIDGLAVGPFEKALAKGQLPHIAGLLRTRPTSAMRAISTFPSATSPSVPEFVSGRYAELENLPAPGAVHAFDREQRRVIRYLTNPDFWQWPLVTLFDATRHLSSITVFEGRWDGPKSILTQFNMTRQAVMEIIGAHELAEGDRPPVEAFLEVVRSAGLPALSFVVMNDFDMAAHFYGPYSYEAQEALKAIDALFGEILATLAAIPGKKKSSILDETNIILFGDHGHVASSEFVDLQAFFNQQGLKAVDVSTIPHIVFRERLGSLWTEWPDVILVSGGSNIAQVYLKQKGDSWEKASAPDSVPRHAKMSGSSDLPTLAAAISGIRGIDQVLWQDSSGSTYVRAADNRSARIATRTVANEVRYAYVVDEKAQQDPFAYLDSPATRSLVCREHQVGDSCFLRREEWFDRTFGSPYPGAVALVPKAFHPQRFTGDLMVTLKPGYSFLRGQQGDHGNLSREAVLTPLILNGPGIGPCRERHRAKLVDLYPSVAVLLGAAADDPAFNGLDGRVLDCVSGQ
ncbi:MAG: alkaline phosphatase family protein [Desulfuromonadales bacterium]|nr:alkaline phosphatase family protein [Desulfuromonadales bacterium]